MPQLKIKEGSIILQLLDDDEEIVFARRFDDIGLAGLKITIHEKGNEEGRMIFQGGSSS